VSDNVRVSVVIPVHDAEADAEGALRSALQSHLRELEVIVVDNGLKDRSTGIVASLSDSRATAVRLRPGRGPSRARNVGIARARAAYVALLDPDDLIKPEMLSAAANALDQHAEAGFAFGDFERIDAASKVTRRSATADFRGLRTLPPVPLEGHWHLIPQAQLARGLLHENFIATSVVVLRKQLLTEIGPFDESAEYAADLDLWFRLAHRCGALFWDNVGHSRRDRPGRLRDAAHVQSAADRISVLGREKSRWTDRSARRQLDRRIALDLAGMGYEERRRRHRLRSIAMFAHAFRTFPDARWLRAMLGSILR
jgi:glycosyltransferase involved in cell wall biosynthesis